MWPVLICPLGRKHGVHAPYYDSCKTKTRAQKIGLKACRTGLGVTATTLWCMGGIWLDAAHLSVFVYDSQCNANGRCGRAFWNLWRIGPFLVPVDGRFQAFLWQCVNVSCSVSGRVIGQASGATRRKSVSFASTRVLSNYSPLGKRRFVTFKTPSNPLLPAARAKGKALRAVVQERGVCTPSPYIVYKQQAASSASRGRFGQSTIPSLGSLLYSCLVLTSPFP